MRKGARGRTDRDGSDAEILPVKGIGQTQGPGRVTAHGEERGCRDRDYGGTDVRMEESMERILSRQDVVQRLDIHQHVSRAEGQKAHVSRCRGVDRGTGSEVKGRYGHEVRAW